MKIVFTQNHPDAKTVAYLRQRNIALDVPNLPGGRPDRDLGEDELVSLLAEADGWIVGHAKVTRSLLSRLPNLKVISRRGVGYDRVDIEAVRDLGRVLAIGAGGNDASVADFALAMMLSLSCRLPDSQTRMRKGDWKIVPSHDLTGKTVGLIGYGRIGKSVARRLSGFDVTVQAYQRTTTRDVDGTTFTSLDRVLEQSDIVSLHLPLNSESHHLIDAEAIAKMKQGSILINTARGGLVDDRALLEALERGHLSGAGLDVFESESNPAMADITQKLISRSDVVCAPHAGASSIEGLERTNMVAAQAAAAILLGNRPPEGTIIVSQT